MAVRLHSFDALRLGFDKFGSTAHAKNAKFSCRHISGRAVPAARSQKLIFEICPLFPTNHPACGLANPTAQ